MANSAPTVPTSTLEQDCSTDEGISLNEIQFNSNENQQSVGAVDFLVDDDNESILVPILGESER